MMTPACWKRRSPGCRRTTPRRCGRVRPWARLRFAVDATAYPRPDTRAPRAGSTSTTAPATARARPRPRPARNTAHRGHRAPAHRVGGPGRRRAYRARDRTAQTIAQVKSVLRRLSAAGHGMSSRRCSSSTPARAPPRSRKGFSAARSTSWSARAGSVSMPIPSPGKAGTGAPPAGGGGSLPEPADSPLPPPAAAAGPEEALPPNPEPGETLTLPDTPLYGTVRAEAWHDVHPLIHGTTAGSPAGSACGPAPAPSSTSPSSACPRPRPHRAMWLWQPARPLFLDEWRAYLARFDMSTRSAPSRHSRPHRAKVRTL